MSISGLPGNSKNCEVLKCLFLEQAFQMPYFVAFEPEKTEIAIWWQSEVCSFEKLAVKTVNIMILFINRLEKLEFSKKSLKYFLMT